MRALQSTNAALRKHAARRLVGKLPKSLIAHALELFQEETSPDVNKWLGMALARTGDRTVAPHLVAKRAETDDANARDWLLASETALEPLHAAGTGMARARSAEVSDQRDGSIMLWAAHHLSESASTILQSNADVSSDPDVRRWSVLALHQHHIGAPVEILLNNIAAHDYLLREWSLHALTRTPYDLATPVVMRIVESAIEENPRVIEWAVHALCAADRRPDVDDLLIAVHRESDDQGVRDACLSELGRRLAPAGVDYLIDQLRTASDPTIALAAVSLRDISSPPLPTALSHELDLASRRLQTSDDLIVMLADGLRIPDSLRSQADAMLADPTMRMYVRSQLAVGYGASWHAQQVTARPLTVGIVVALKEEFGYLEEIWPQTRYARHPSSEADYYHTTLEFTDASPVELVISLVGRKGETFAIDSSRGLITDHSPDIMVSLGISGSISSEAGLGDVVIGEGSTSYLANVRAEDGPSGFELLSGTETFRSTKALIDRAVRLDIEHRELYCAWQAETTRWRAEVGLTGHARSVHGPIAAGPAVVASTSFQAWIHRQNRSYIAVDMESSAVAQASWSTKGIQPALLLLRGISDTADAQKAALDATSKAAYRRLATRTVGSYLALFLHTRSKAGSAT